jgi:hypothetical protein
MVDMPFKDKQKNRDYQKDWARKHRVEQRTYAQRLKVRAVEKLGGRCIYCGCDNINALEFNHINGGGNKEARAVGGGNQKEKCLDILAGRRTDLELSCRVCNALHYLVKLKGLPNRWKVTYE